MKDVHTNWMRKDLHRARHNTKSVDKNDRRSDPSMNHVITAYPELQLQYQQSLHVVQVLQGHYIDY